MMMPSFQSSKTESKNERRNVLNKHELDSSGRRSDFSAKKRSAKRETRRRRSGGLRRRNGRRKPSRICRVTTVAIWRDEKVNKVTSGKRAVRKREKCWAIEGSR